MQKRFSLFAVFVLFALNAFAQNNAKQNNPNIKSITLNEAVVLALKNNVSIKREEISLGAAKRASAHSWNSILPSISVSANDEIELPDLNKRANNAATGVQNNVGVEGRVALSMSSDFFASIKKAKLDYESACISFEQAVSEITSQIKETYFSLILAKQNLDFMKENLENAKNQFKQNEERYRHGTLSELEYLSSKVSYEKLKPELKSQELAFKNDMKAFCLFLGLEDEQIALKGSLEDFINQYKNIFNDALKAELSEDVKNGNIPSIAYLEKQLEAAKKGVSVSRLSAYGPNANLSYSVNPVITGIDKGRVKQSASVSISIPLDNLLPFSKGADSVKAAKDSVKDLQLQLVEKNRTAKADFAYIIQSLNQKEESIASLKDLVKLAQKNYEAVKYSYSKGTTEFLSVQNASKDNLESKLNLQNEYIETLKLYISLEKLCGKNAL